MYEELVKRLRNLSGTDNIAEFDEAADAIEELNKVSDAIPNVCECCIGCEVESGGCDNAFVLSPKRAREYLSQPRWILVTERLPEKDGMYLAHGTWLTSGRKATDTCEFYVHDGYFRAPWNFDVTHWMPIPPIPKEG